MSAPRRLPIDWHPVLAIPIPATTVAGYQAFTRGGRLYGWSFQETTGAAGAAFELYDGNSANAQSLLPAVLNTNQGFRDIWGKPGIEIRSGLFINVTAGTVKGNLFVLALSPEEILARAGYEYTS